MRYYDFTAAVTKIPSPEWMLAYATVDVPLQPFLSSLSSQHPDIKLFGCTSARGVFTRSGFQRGIHVLAGQGSDGVQSAPVFRGVGAGKARVEARSAALEMRKALGGDPSSILMHATPGFEERVLEGVDDAFEGSPPAVYGGSAADDDLSGRWAVFSGTKVASEGFVLVGFRSERRILGSFVSGYTPSKTRGVVTAARGRVLDTIDGRPAAIVYDEWTHGSIQPFLDGGNVLAVTTLSPLGRVVDRVGNLPSYLLSHPHRVLPGGALELFTEVGEGDELVLMLGSEGALVDRSSQALSRALRGAEADRRLLGGIVLYCAGCVAAIGDRTAALATDFARNMGWTPFVGAATYGEQGAFHGQKSTNRHGNLMCDAVLFAG